jgi:hypothetical protein
VVGAVTMAIAVSGGARPTPVEAAAREWKIVPAPAIAGSVDLTGVVAFGPDDAWAVGYAAQGEFIETVTLHWDGTAWSRVPSPNPSAERNWLVDVAGTSPTDVWAVGSAWNQARDRETLVMHWDGSAWKVVPSPNVDGTENLFNGVAAVSPTQAWAVGSSVDPSFSGRTLTQRWDGRSWTIVPSPNPSETGVGSNLLDVAARSARDVWAVGNVDTGDFVMGTLTEHWKGMRWRAVGSPTAPEGALLDAVSVDRAGRAWAVGWRQRGDVLQPLAMRWKGARWRAVAAPSFPGVTADFADVAALGRDDVWAVGTRGNRTLAAHWDGRSWTVTPSADPGTVANNLLAVAAVPGSACLWAVGAYVEATPAPLIERSC